MRLLYKWLDEKGAPVFIKQCVSVVLVGVLLSPPLSLAAVNQATLLGSVSGTSAPLAGVELGLVNLDTGRVTSTQTDKQGGFVAQVPAGLYFVDTARAGYPLVRGPRVVSLAPGQVLSTTFLLAAQDPQAGEFRLIHDPVECMIADQSPEILASVAPASTGVTAQVYFHSAHNGRDRSVPMSLSDRGLVVGLPRPQLGDSPVTYFVSVTGPQGTRRTNAIQAIVVKEEKDCGSRKVAAIFPGAAPVMAGSAGTPVLLLAAGAAVLGGGAAILIGSGGNTTPASPTR